MSDGMTTVQIDQILARRKILVTCGTGGVGKTTLSSAIAIRAAHQGRKTIVVTMDPAKRLATSLGLKHLGNEPMDLTSLIPGARGTLHALMPDTRKTFEEFVDELAPDRTLAERIKRNPIFQIFAKEFSGTNEYMALEKLYALNESGRYDCIVLDTPPSRNTLDFLDAPKLLAQFFEERLIKWLVLPANRIVQTGMKKALSILEKLTGAGFMTSLFEFASALFEVRVRFTANLKKVTALLESEQVGFLMVTTPQPDTVQEAAQFIRSIGEHRFHFDGLALNRTLSYLPAGQPASEPVESPQASEALAIIAALQAREKLVLEQLHGNSIPICATLPELARDIHSVEDLFHVAMAFGSSGSR
jgi:anion-transporting  ArsA/GET3 family ATPase